MSDTWSAVFAVILRKREPIFIGFAVIVVCLAGYFYYLAPPANFPSDSIVTIPDGTSGADAATILEQSRIIQSPIAVRVLLRLSGASGVHAGAYRFVQPENVFTVAYRLAAGDFGIALARITFPEGLTVHDMSLRVTAALPDISADDFTAAAAPYEGYLFPDTYTFAPTATVGSIVAQMRANFTNQLSPALQEIVSSGHTLSDIVIMASLVEKEARSTEARKMVAGILWNRIHANMPLQVDAVFGYIKRVPTYSPSLDDLTIDSPYNTYTHVGLPPGPIDNPGIAAIEAAANPTPSKYFYYLTDANGVMHYAVTFAEHKANRAKYLQ